MEASSAQSPLLTYPQLQNALRIEFTRARRYGYPLSCVIVELDGLDRVREIHGAGVRDHLIRRVVMQSVQSQTRSSDSTGLYHDRIVLILPHTPLPGARAVAERIREMTGRTAIPVSAPVGGPEGTIELHVTLSIGVAAFQDQGTLFFDSILKAAETALAQAVAAGGDRIEVTTIAAAPPSA